MFKYKNIFFVCVFFLIYCSVEARRGYFCDQKRKSLAVNEIEVKRYASYSAFAYCPTKNRDLADFQNFELWDSFFAYTAVQHKTKEIIVSFRGTTSITNWIVNIISSKFNCLLIQRLCNLVHTDDAHYGYKVVYKLMSLNLTKSIKAKALRYSNYRIVFTGHSMGGSLAAIALNMMQLDFKAGEIYLITFSSPKTGDAKFTSVIKSKACVNLKFISYPDIVPLYTSQANFEHESDLVISMYSNRKFMQLIDCQMNDYCSEFYSSSVTSDDEWELIPGHSNVLDSNDFFKRTCNASIASIHDGADSDLLGKTVNITMKYTQKNLQPKVSCCDSSSDFSGKLLDTLFYQFF